MKPVLPTLVGQPRNAELNARPVATPASLNGLGESISNLVPAANSLLNVVANIKAENDELDYRKTYNEAVAESNKRLQEEVYSQSGFGAAGSLDRANKIFDDTFQKYGSRFQGRRYQRFENEFSGRRNTLTPSIMGHEHGQVKGARLGANEERIKSEIDTYIVTQDPRALDNIRAAYDDSWAQIHGRRLDSGSIAAFDEDLNDGDNTITLPGGKKLTIVDQETGQEGTISRERLMKIRGDMEKEAENYENGLKKLYDSAHSRVVDRLLKDGQADAAEAYLKQITAEGYSQPVTEGTAGVIRQAIDLQRKEQSIITDSGIAAQRVIATGAQDPRSSGGKYWTDATEKAYAEELDRLNAEAANDPTGLAKRKVSAFQSFIASQRAAALAHEKADLHQALKEFSDDGILGNPHRIEELKSKVIRFGDSPVRDQLIEIVTRKERAIQDAISKDQEVKRQRESIVLEFKRKIALGEPISFGQGQNYDPNDNKQLAAAAAIAGLTPQEIASIESYIQNQRVDTSLAARTVASALNELNGYKKGKERFTEQNILRLCPEILTELEEVAKYYPEINLKSKEGKDWLERQVTSILRSKQAMESDWLGRRVKPVYLHEFLGRGFDTSGRERSPREGETAMTMGEFLNLGRTPEQIKMDIRNQQELRGTAIGTAVYPDDIPTRHADAAAQKQGLVKDTREGVYRPKKAQDKVEKQRETKRREDDEKLNIWLGGLSGGLR